jgi:DGQHR domain-containing protein
MKFKKYEIPAIINHQWLKEWDQVSYGQNQNREKPQSHFYVFTIKAKWLKKLSNVYSRKADKRRIDDTAIQRIHDPRRSKKINKYVIGGFPWSDLDEKQQQLAEYNDQRMPGWLPTAIVVNILRPEDKRNGKSIKTSDIVKIQDRDQNSAKLILPKKFLNKKWEPVVFPIEVIDGQHRLWAFEMHEELGGEYELPVVAFHGLDIAWQAYLFYTINIKPKKINASLAFDLYPLLRVQEWLEKSPDGSSIYRDTRAQELTEALWSHMKSPWNNRINMLGEKGIAGVTQAAFIRSLTSSFLRTTKKKGIGGLFSSPLQDQTILKWNRPQQAAFLMLTWQAIEEAVSSAVFAGKYSLLSTDQGVRGYLTIMNDMCYSASDSINFSNIKMEEEINEEIIDDKDVDKALKHFHNHESRDYIFNIAKELKKFNWRASSDPSLSDAQKNAQSVYRGGSGYKILRENLLEILSESKNQLIRSSAMNLIKSAR